MTTVSHPSSVKTVVCMSLQPVPVQLVIFHHKCIIHSIVLTDTTIDTKSNYSTNIQVHLYNVTDELVTNPTQSKTDTDEIDTGSNVVAFITNNLILTDGQWLFILISHHL